jgi:hypothetical protein
MAGRTEREELRIRKQALILESGMNRRLLQTQWRELQEATAWLGEVRRLGRGARTWLPLLAPLAGWLALRGRKHSAPLANRTGSLLSWIEIARSIWNGLAAHAKRDQA